MKQHTMLSMFTNPHYSNQPKLEGEKYNHYEHEREKKERRTSAFSLHPLWTVSGFEHPCIIAIVLGDL
jgi:hypothetical protein